MKMNRIKFPTLKTQWEINKMKAAYILAERALIEDPSLSGFEDQIPQVLEFESDGFGNIKMITPQDSEIAKVESQIEEIKESGRKLLEEDKYELFIEAKEIYEKLEKRLAELKSNR